MIKNNSMKTIRFAILTISAVFVMCSAGWGATYYVDGTNGNDLNPGTLSSPWQTISKANNTLQAGDTVYLRAGTYTQTIEPANSGTPGKYITYTNYNGEQVTITPTGEGADLSNKDYIVLDGLHIDDPGFTWVMMHGASYNIIQNCTFTGAAGTSWGGIYLDRGADYNKILNNTLTGNSSGPGDLIFLEGEGKVGIVGTANYNLIEGNTLGYAKHADINIQLGDNNTTYRNIVRNNIMNSQKHTNLIAFKNAHSTLVENNIMYDAGADANAFQFSGNNCIIRNNLYYTNQRWGFNISQTGGYPVNNCRIYNETYYDTKVRAISTYFTDGAGSVFKNLLFYMNTVNLYNHGTATTVNNTWTNNADVGQDPLFINAGNGNFNLEPTSPMIDAGAFLTTTTSSGSGTTIQVADAKYFMDGWGIIEGDLIQLEGQTQKARITEVDYNSNIITVDTSLSWNNGQGVSLAYQGSAPDIGAYEYASDSSGTNPAVPLNLRVISPN